jgi:DNA-binding CsgD family transcriptional regulator
MILNLLSDDGFLSVAISAIVREVGNFKFVVTAISDIPFGVEETEKKVIYLVDSRALRSDIKLWLLNDDNHHVVFLSFSDLQSHSWEVFGPVFDLSGSVRMVKHVIKNILLSALSEHENDVATYPPLTQRESEIYFLLIEGWSVEKIADYFNCSPKTVYGHRSKISKKKGARRFYNLHNEINIRFG